MNLVRVFMCTQGFKLVYFENMKLNYLKLKETQLESEIHKSYLTEKNLLGLRATCALYQIKHFGFRNICLWLYVLLIKFSVNII